MTTYSMYPRTRWYNRLHYFVLLFFMLFHIGMAKADITRTAENIAFIGYDFGDMDESIVPTSLNTGVNCVPLSTVVAPPTVVSTAVTGVGAVKAALGGNVTADGGASVTERGIVWGTSANPTTANNKVQIGSGAGAFGALVSGLPAGTTIHFRAYAINSAGTTYGADISFMTNAALSTSSTSKTDLLCYGGTTGSASVNVIGGKTPYSYSWSPSGGTAATASGLSAGNYTCRITDGEGTQITRTFTIEQPAAFTVGTSQTNVSYNGESNGTAMVSVSGATGPYTYSWTPSGGTGPMASGLAAGAYTVTITDVNSCQTTRTFTITQPAGSVVSATSLNTFSSCAAVASTAQSFTVQASGLTSNLTIEAPTGFEIATSVTEPYYNNISFVPISGAISLRTIYVRMAATATGTPSGNIIISSTGITANNVAVTGSVKEAPVITGQPAATTGCAGQVATLTVTATNATSYKWVEVDQDFGEIALTNDAIYSGTTTAKLTINSKTSLNAKVYKVIITGACGAILSSNSATLTIGDPGTPTLVTPGVQNFCQINAPTFSDIQFNESNIVWYTDLTGGISIPANEALTSGTYYAAIRDLTTGCESATRLSVIVSIADPLVVNVSVSNIACNGGATGSATVVVTGGTPGYTYRWTRSGSATSIGARPNIAGLAAGKYSCEITDFNGCSIVKNITVTEPDPIRILLNKTNPTTVGGVDGSITATISGGVGGYTYSWTPNVATNNTANSLAAGTYKLTVTDAYSCTVEESITLSDPPAVSAITRLDSSPTNASAVKYNVVFSKPVTGVDINDFTLSTTDGVLGDVSGLSGSGSTYTVTVTGVTGDGTLRLNLKSAATGIVDDENTPIVGGYTAGEVYVIDNKPPKVPANFKAVGGDAKITLTWDANTESDLKQYRLYVTPEGGTKTLLETLLKGTNRYLHTGLSNGATYSYFLSAEDNTGNSSVEAIAAAKTIGEQTITFGALSAMTYGDTDKTLTATAGSGLPVSYVSSNPAIASVYQDAAAGNKWKVRAYAAGTVVITATQAGDNQYLPATPIRQSLTIDKAPLTITADAQSKVYGAAVPVLTFSYSGLVNGDTQVATEPTITTAATASSAVGVYPVTLSGASDANYTITLKDNTLTVDQAPLTITADAQSKVYGAAVPVLTFSYSGLVNGDTQVATEPTITTAATASSAVGVYPVTLSGASDANYTITLENNTLTVDQAPLTITADAQSKIYGAVVPTLTFSYSGLVNGDTKATTEPTIATTATASSAVGVYPVTLSGASDANYTVTLKDNTLTVGQAPLTITADAQSKVYGQADPALTYQVAGLVNNDSRAIITGKLSRVVGENVGTYSINKGNLDAGANYTMSYTGANLSIGKATITGVTLTDETFTYDGTAKSLFLTGTLPTGAVANYTDNVQTSAGVYPVKAEVSETANYKAATFNATLTILKAKQTISFTAPEVLSRDAGTVALDVRSSSGLPVALSVDDPSIATVSGTDLHVLRLGTVHITAVQAGNENYEAAAPVIVSVRVQAAVGSKLPVLVNQGLSPNGDGINDFLRIEGIQDYPENRVTIFDKNGSVLAEIEGYNNRDKVFTGRENRDGTYFYYIDVKDNGVWKREKGYFVIRR